MKNPLSVILVLLAAFAACKQPFEPPVLKQNHNYLVVDGVLVNSADSPTVITLSRTRNLSDTVIFTPVTQAQVTVEGSGGEHFTFTEGGAGSYRHPGLVLNATHQYRLRILAAGKSYVSAFVPVKTSPPIDSLSWAQPNDLTIYAHTHDPSNQARYYRWDYVETWQYRSQIQSDMELKNGQIVILDSTNQFYNCWRSRASTDIVTGTSIALASDVISQAPVLTIFRNDERATVRYSVLVKQYALTPEAYRYLQVLKKNSQELGSLFDAQPAELRGNITCETDPQEPVVGFVSASSVTMKRIFISNQQLQNWAQTTSGFGCQELLLPYNANNYPAFTPPEPDYLPIYFTSTGHVAIVRRNCVDCRIRGGINQKPGFW